MKKLNLSQRTQTKIAWFFCGYAFLLLVATIILFVK